MLPNVYRVSTQIWTMFPSYVRSTRVINDMIYDYDESSIRSYTFA